MALTDVVEPFRLFVLLEKTKEFMRSNMPWKSLCVTGAPSFSLKLSQFLGESVVLGVKNNADNTLMFTAAVRPFSAKGPRS